MAAACVVVAVSFRIFDTDLWQHLARARAMLATHGIPMRQIWTWPMYGAPEKNAAWAYALLLWPFWSAGGIAGLFVWRWLTALAAFGVVWAVARRLGARGFSALVVVVACALVYRQRSQMRPETIAMILLGLELWILETRRQGGPDRTWWLVPIAWVWPNLHVSYYIGLLVLALFAIAGIPDTRPAGVRGKSASRRAPVSGAGRRGAPLFLVLAVATAVSFLNPFGAAGLESPFEFFLKLRHEPLYQGIGELKPVDWAINLRNGLPALMFAWPLLQIWRWRRGRPDLLEAVLWALFTVEALSAQRFLAFWCVVAAPYLARGLAEWLAARRFGVGMTSARRATGAAIACAALAAVECSRADLPLGLSLDPASVPGPACDFMASAGVSGRGFNYFEHGGYLLWRFWPDRNRLPFMTTIPELATPEMRLAYQRAMLFPQDWRSMASRYGFDWVLLKRTVPPGDRYQDFLDADSSFTLVFLDDVSALYVGREGRLRGVAERYRYRRLAAGQVGLDAAWREAGQSAVVRAELRAELVRAAEASPLHFVAGRHRAALDSLLGR